MTYSMSPQKFLEQRKKLDMTQKELALELGISLSTLRNWEKGRVKIPLMYSMYINRKVRGLL